MHKKIITLLIMSQISTFDVGASQLTSREIQTAEENRCGGEADSADTQYATPNLAPPGDQETLPHLDTSSSSSWSRDAVILSPKLQEKCRICRQRFLSNKICVADHNKNPMFAVSYLAERDPTNGLFGPAERSIWAKTDGLSEISCDFVYAAQKTMNGIEANAPWKEIVLQVYKTIRYVSLLAYPPFSDETGVFRRLGYRFLAHETYKKYQQMKKSFAASPAKRDQLTAYVIQSANKMVAARVPYEQRTSILKSELKWLVENITGMPFAAIPNICNAIEPSADYALLGWWYGDADPFDVKGTLKNAQIRYAQQQLVAGSSSSSSSQTNHRNAVTGVSQQTEVSVNVPAINHDSEESEDGQQSVTPQADSIEIPEQRLVEDPRLLPVMNPDGTLVTPQFSKG